MTKKKTAAGPPTTWAEFKALKRPVTDEMKLCADRALLQEAKELRARAEDADRRYRVILGIGEQAPPEMVAKAEEALAEAQEAAEKAEAAADEVSMTFVFQAMGGHDLEELMKDHRPTPAQQKDYQEQQKAKGLPTRDFLEYNPDTFPKHLIAGTLIQPEMSVEEAADMLVDPNFSQGELMAILTNAWNVNQILSK